MKQRPFDAETLRESFVYLYRSWLQSCLTVRPERLALSATDGILTTSGFVLYYTLNTVDLQTVAEIKNAFNRPIFIFAEELPPDVLGTTHFTDTPKAKAPFDQVLLLLWERMSWLDSHSERGLAVREAYETKEFGRFAIWKKGQTTRLILRPENSDLYGYVVIRNAPNDYFLRRSKTCKEEGSNIGSGQYKRCDHKVETKIFPNFDLLSDAGGVMLLKLTLAGAGYKAFPRKSCEGTFEI